MLSMEAFFIYRKCKCETSVIFYHLNSSPEYEGKEEKAEAGIIKMFKCILMNL
jgi:hypothetical protein